MGSSDLDADDETLGGAALLERELGARVIEEIRGVDSGSALKVLLDRGVLKILGRKDEPGRPLLYGTPPFFLEFFGLNSLDELPTLKEFSDLRVKSAVGSQLFGLVTYLASASQYRVQNQKGN